MRQFFAQADLLLRGPEHLAASGRLKVPTWRFVAFVLICGSFYGAVMGTFGGLSGDRMWQVVFSATKAPLLLLATFAICLPSFFILNTLLGVRDDFAQVVRALAASQAGITLVLVALAPYTLLWYASFSAYREAILFNGLLFAIASLAGQWLLFRCYRPLIARSSRHRLLLRIWLGLYVFVGMQMAWILRPFVGMPEMPVQFFRADAWGNAYVVIARMIWEAIKQ